MEIVPRRIAAAGSASLILFAFGLAACGTDSATVGSAVDSASVRAPEEVVAPAAEVAAGLHQIDGIVTQAAQTTATDAATAHSLTGQIEPVWSRIEGAVKANDPDAYLTFEDAFAAIEKAAAAKDAAAARQAASSVTATVNAYLAAHPG